MECNMTTDNVTWRTQENKHFEIKEEQMRSKTVTPALDLFTAVRLT